ncbi:MAG TPA: DMT family transporter [Ornithinimicrobium sp.]|uniref:EamA family transporter n=1 Tax=Ornithinimicrobium sp. TaxID=1977084 RepID=UPI002B4778F7|nr:DMT family transporter [Ornithinimicrobium sp.]HKJ11565.1 DMT family transporter [Ornithinimicrobium sp.]
MTAVHTISPQRGLVLALVSAAAFGSSGALGKSLLETGWSPVAAVAGRAAIGALVLLAPAVVVMRGRWESLRRSWPTMVLFGALGVGVAQGAFYQAVQHIDVGVAIMLEYLGILLVVLWLWGVHGQRPRTLTVVGMALAVVGLALVLNVFGATAISSMGLFWGLLAAVGLASYFVLGSDDTHGTPPLAIATGGLVFGAVSLAAAGALGWAEWSWSTAPVVLAGTTMPFWVSLVSVGVGAAAVAYGIGVVATRQLGSKMASFVGLTEVLFSVLFAWLLLGQLPGLIQLLGGAVILAGVVAVKLDEEPDGQTPPASAFAGRRESTRLGGQEYPDRGAALPRQ